MNCEQMMDLLNNSDAATLESEANPAVRDHLDGCAACRDIYATHRQLAPEIGSCELPEPPAGRNPPPDP